jgi:glycosyltransferase involved in cell wall biosynthesis
MRPRVLLLVPLYGWAFHHIALQLARRLSDRYQFTIRVLKEVSASERYDLTVSLLWTEAERLRGRMGESTPSIACLFDHASWVSDAGAKLFARTLRNVHAVAVGNPALVEVAQRFGARQTVLCQDGIDLELFHPLPLPDKFTVGWCGNVAIGDGTYKGLDLIKAAAERVGVPLVVQDFEKKVPHHEMPGQFYGHISAYICASMAEGTPNPVFEALACGRPVITTRVGLTDQVVRPGVNGIFVDREVDAIAAAIRELRTWGDRSKECRAAVEPHGWDVAAERWTAVLDAALCASQQKVVATQQGAL